LDPRLASRFEAELQKVWPDWRSGRLGVAVSGGGDSLALLILAREVLPQRVEAATVDHQLRPGSAAEAAAVGTICQRLAVPHQTLNVTLEPGNLQVQARHARYAALARWADDRDLAAIATAHHADDQAETLLLRLNRGSGLSGLAGIRRSTLVPGTALPLLRPLLCWRRTELREIVNRAGLAAIEDPSNDDRRFDRVRLREALAGADWLDIANIARSADHLDDAHDYLRAALEQEWSAMAVRKGAEIILDPPRRRYAQIALVTRAVQELGGTPRGGAVAALVDRLGAGRGGTLAGVLARVRNGRWVFATEPPRRKHDPDGP
jgi:tRNA(Ile)-lysidine synthase